MTHSIALLGRQPALGIAELEKLVGADKLHPISNHMVMLDVAPDDVPFHRLGGTIKLAKLLTRLDTTQWTTLIDYIADTIPEHLQYIPEGKIRIGLNTYGLRVSVSDINRAGLRVKKTIKQAGRSVRVVPNTTPELNSAQTLHNQLTGPCGIELALIRDGTNTLLAQIVAVQDIDAYAARDQKRPKRDARVGMLPPKLAQIIINLASAPGLTPKDATLTSDHIPRLLDPFCGTGVLLQEALLMGHDVQGTDLEPRMIAYSQENLEWLAERHQIGQSFHLTVGDATNHTWESPIDTVACETYLGKPFAASPPPALLRQVVGDVNTLHKKFLRNLASQLAAGTPVCLAVPAWRQKQGFTRLPVLDQLEELGYTRVSFVHARTRDLVYHRDNQVVARELVALIKH